MSGSASGWSSEFYGHLLSVLTFAMTVVFIAVLLRSRRPPANMLAWLVVIGFVPYVGIPLFLMLGGRKMGARGPGKSPIYARVPYEATPGNASRMERVLRSRGAPDPVPNEAIEYLDSGEKAYAALLQGIRGARHSIDCATFILKRDETGNSLLKELTLKAREGVRVRLLLDAVGSNPLIRPSLGEFRRAGGEVAFFMPLLHIPFRGRVNLRNHRKVTLFDGSWAWLGGLNLASEYLGPTARESRWEDLSVRIRGQTARQLMQVFDWDWAYAGGAPSRASPSGPEQGQSAGPEHLAQVVASGPDTPGDSLYEALLEACFDARNRIWIATPYFVPDESLIKALELACRRGVDVRLLMPGRSNHFFADLSRGSYVRQLLAAGGHVYRFPKMMHAKLVVVDDTFALAGSANFDLRSLLYNYEIGVFLYSEPEVAQAADWMQARMALSRGGYTRARFWRGLAEGVGRLFGPLL